MSDEEPKGGFDKGATEEAVRSLKEQLDDPTLKSSARILILVLLALARRMSSVQLRALTGLGKGSLENHLDRLESVGYVTISYSKSMGARGTPRQTVEITEKGLNDCRALIGAIRGISL